jgi:ATP-dependent DNA helicase RecG
LDKTEFLDQRSVRGPAFKLLEEAELFCQRHFPLPGRILPGKLQREDRPLIPPDAMREILVNALIHRDYSNAGGAVYLAIYDDRVEVWSTGTFPNGIRPEMLSREHKSVLRNPIIADVFHRAGLIEKWGRGTNRVIAMCRDAGIPAPEFEETAGAAVVRFRVKVGPTPQVTPQVPDKYPTSARQVLTALAKSQEPLPRAALQEASGLRDREHFVNEHLKLLVSGGLIEMTIAAKPRSSRQKYRLTDKGRAWLIGGLPASEDL